MCWAVGELEGFSRQTGQAVPCPGLVLSPAPCSVCGRAVSFSEGKDRVPVWFPTPFLVPAAAFSVICSLGSSLLGAGKIPGIRPCLCSSCELGMLTLNAFSLPQWCCMRCAFSDQSARHRQPSPGLAYFLWWAPPMTDGMRDREGYGLNCVPHEITRACGWR